MLVLFFMILGTIIAGCSVPFYQYCKEKCKSKKKQRIYFFDENLFEHDTDNLCFENVTLFRERENNRCLINSRGSIRQANGILYSADIFESEKVKVYEIKLP